MNNRINYLLDVINLDWVRLTLEADNSNENVINDPQYWQDIQNIVANVGSKPGKYIEVSIWLDPSLQASKNGIPNEGDPNVPGGPSATTLQEWLVMIKVFKSQPHVIIGIAHEPITLKSNSSGVQYLYNAMNYVAGSLRLTGANNLFLVQCASYSSDCSIYLDNPINDTNVAYEVHLYAPASSIDTSLMLDLPLIVSETAVDNDCHDDSGYETVSDFIHLVHVCQTRNIPYAGWSLDEACCPNMLATGSCDTIDPSQPQLSNWGQLFLQGASCAQPHCGINE